MVKVKGNRWLLSAVAAGSMIAAIGCEAVGGVDLNGAVASMYDVQSSEGTMNLRWDIAGDAADAEGDRILQAFGSGAIVVTEMLQEDAQTLSMEGEIQLPKGNLPFSFYMNEDELVVDVEGAVKPFKLDLTSTFGAEASADLPFDASQLSDVLQQDAGREAVKKLIAYVASHVPNPASTTVGTTTETIDGATKTLAKVTMEADFEELLGMLATAIGNVASDEAGLKELIGSLYDTLKPVLGELTGASEDPFMSQLMDNKTLMVELIYTSLAPELQSLAEELQSSATEEMELPFSADSGLKVELLLDGAQPAGMNVGLVLEPAEGEADGLESIRIELESRWWNVNGDVDAKTYVGAAADFPLDAKPRDRLDNIEKDSLLYDILKNDLRATRHAFDMYMGENASVPDGVSPYIKGAGTTMVPVRYVSEQLDATVGWDGATQTITIADAEEGITIEMVVGKTTATVNGQETALPEAPEIINQSTFVPIAFITKALGGKAEWNGSLGIVTITKEF